jgi:hypothetical protein
MDGWMICEFDDMGLADGAANSLLYIWMEKFSRTNNQLSLVLLGRINSYQPWTRLGRADSSTHGVVV